MPRTGNRCGTCNWAAPFTGIRCRLAWMVSNTSPFPQAGRYTCSRCRNRSKVRVRGRGDWIHVVAEPGGVVIGADLFVLAGLNIAAIMLTRVPRHRKGPRVLDMNAGLERFALVGNAVSLHHMQFVGMRRAVAVHKGSVIEADRIYDQCIAAFIMAHGFAEP